MSRRPRSSRVHPSLPLLSLPLLFPLLPPLLLLFARDPFPFFLRLHQQQPLRPCRAPHCLCPAPLCLCLALALCQASLLYPTMTTLAVQSQRTLHPRSLTHSLRHYRNRPRLSVPLNRVCLPHVLDYLCLQLVCPVPLLLMPATSLWRRSP